MILISSSRDIAIDDVSAGLPMSLEIVGGADKTVYATGAIDGAKL